MARPPRSLIVGAVLLTGCGGAGPGVERPTLDLSDTTPATETFEDADLWHLQFVMGDEAKLRYVDATPEARAELMRIVWAELDPTPTTPANERKEEHFRRLGYARANFAIDEPPHWDRRGELLLRYGVPDQRRITDADVVDVLGLVPAREVWVYHWLGQAYRLEDQRFQGDFQDHYDVRLDFRDTSDFRDEARVPGTDDTDRDPRNPTGPQYDEVLLREYEDLRDEAGVSGPEFVVLDAEEQVAADRLQILYARGQEAYRGRPAAYAHDHGGEKLDFVFDVSNFRPEASNRTRVDVNTAFWASDLQYQREGDGWVAVLGVEAVAKTMDYREVARVSGTTHDPKEHVEDLTGRLVLDQITLDLEPGPYRLALTVRDSLSGNVGIYTTEMLVRSFPDDLAISDVQLALEVRSAEPGDAFRKGPFQIVPYPLGTFPRGRDVCLYFEIYGLESSPKGDVFYTIDLMIKPRTVSSSSWFGSSKGRVTPGVATSFDGRGTKGIVREYVIVDSSTLDADVYDVEITVHDRVFERSVSQSIRFAVGG